MGIRVEDDDEQRRRWPWGLLEMDIQQRKFGLIYLQQRENAPNHLRRP